MNWSKRPDIVEPMKDGLKLTSTSEVCCCGVAVGCVGGWTVSIFQQRREQAELLDEQDDDFDTTCNYFLQGTLEFLTMWYCFSIGNRVVRTSGHFESP